MGRGRLLTLTVAFCLVVVAVCCAATETVNTKAGPYKNLAGKFGVAVVRYNWQDAKRNRPVPVKIYYPVTGDGPLPVVIFSPGLGGTREGYEYLGRHWASWGYVSVHLQHLGSDDAVWKTTALADRIRAMRAVLLDPAVSLNRPLDVSFAIDTIEKMNRDQGPLKGRLDLGKIGIAGHSFGAWTTLAAVGQVFILPGGKEVSLADPRIKAAVPMSAGPPARQGQLDRAFGSIKVPCLHMTGTLDASPLLDTPASDRRVPYDHIKGGDQYLVTFKDGDHMIFSGHVASTWQVPGSGGDPAKDGLFQDLILQSTMAFWDAYLKRDAEARQWLSQGGFKAVLDENGTLEAKLKAVAEPTSKVPKAK